MLKYFSFKVKCVQTDNGCEFTKRFISNKKNNLSMFEKKLKELGIKYKRIRSFTPRHNGTVERSHRKYNNFPICPLGWISPKQYLLDFKKMCFISL